MRDFDHLDSNDFYIMKSNTKACGLYANNLLPYAQLTLANFYAQSTLAIAIVCAVNASNLLPYAPGLWIRIIFFRIRIQSLMLETNTDPDPIRIQGFNDKKLKKITAENFVKIFF